MYYFVPGDKFPAISITGRRCWLNCRHCRGKYLSPMIAVNNSSELFRVAHTLYYNGGQGMLISGGCNPEGAVPIIDFLPGIKKIKKELGLFIAAHPGFITECGVRALENHIDLLLYDVVWEKKIFADIYGLGFTKEFMTNMMRAVSDSAIPYIGPHITVGIYYGRLAGENEALNMLLNARFDTLIINGVMATRNTDFESINVSVSDFVQVAKTARKMFGNKMICMGCMRPRGHKFELAAYKFFDGIAMPAKKTMQRVRGRLYSLCCGVPVNMLQKT